MEKLTKSAPPAKAGRAGASRSDQAELAAYIVEVTTELGRLAGEAGLPMLAYFLNLARVEAQIAAPESDLPELRRGA